MKIAIICANGKAGRLYVNPDHTACVADGERTGKYILGGEDLTLNPRGESIISYADYAVAMIDEVISGNNIQKRISVAGE